MSERPKSKSRARPARPAIEADAAQPAHQLFREQGLRAKRSFGQCFLADGNIARIIASQATTPEGGLVIEIGAGTGALTLPLLERAKRVIAVERDRDLVPILRDSLAAHVDQGKLVVLEDDAVTCEFGAYWDAGPSPRVLAGNIPYQITGPLLQRAIAEAHRLDRVVFMVQKEVADRVVAAVGTKDYGVLSIFVRSAFVARRHMVVPASCFRPRPQIDSAVLVLEPRRDKAVAQGGAFALLVHAAFAKRRKTLRNAWRGVCGLDAEGLDAVAAKAGVRLDDRGEALAPEDFARVAACVAVG